MFPACPITAMDCSATDLPAHRFEDLPGMRIVGLMKQAESLTSYALDLFCDLSNAMESLSERCSQLQNHTAEVEKQTHSALAQYAVKSKDLFSCTQSRSEPFEMSFSAEFALEKSTIVNNMLRPTNPAPNMSRFNALYNEVVANGMGDEDVSNVDFNKFFSDPDFFQRQYRAEILGEMDRQRAAWKQASKQARRVEKKKETRTECKKDEWVWKDAIETPPPPPRGLVMPPPRGLARHEPLRKPEPVATPVTAPKQETAPHVLKPEMVSVPDQQPPMQPVVLKASVAEQKPVEVPAPPPPPQPKPPVLKKPVAEVKKVQEEEPPSQSSFLDLIKTRSWNLKPVDQTKPLPAPKVKHPQRDPATLTMQEILHQAQIMRELLKPSDSSSEEEEESTTSEWNR